MNMIPIIKDKQKFILCEKIPKFLIADRFTQPIPYKHQFHNQFHIQQNNIISLGVTTEYNLHKISKLQNIHSQILENSNILFKLPIPLLFPALSERYSIVYVQGGLQAYGSILLPSSQLIIYDVLNNYIKINPSVNIIGNQIISISSMLVSFGGVSTTQTSLKDLNNLLNSKSQNSLEFNKLSYIIYPETASLQIQLVERAFFAVAVIQKFFVVIIGGINQDGYVKQVEIVNLLTNTILSVQETFQSGPIYCYRVIKDKIFFENRYFSLGQSINTIENYIKTIESPHTQPAKYN